MNFYLSSNHISELSEFSFKQRQIILFIAKGLYTPVEKLTINLIKLCLLAPAFLFLAQVDTTTFIAAMILFIVLYVLLMQPISLLFCKRHLPAALKKFQQSIDVEKETN